METTQLQAKGGEKWGFKLDPLTLIRLNETVDHLHQTAGIKPSHAVVVRRAIQFYAIYLGELKTARKLKDEKAALFAVAGREPRG